MDVFPSWHRVGRLILASSTSEPQSWTPCREAFSLGLLEGAAQQDRNPRGFSRRVQSPSLSAPQRRIGVDRVLLSTYLPGMGA